MNLKTKLLAILSFLAGLAIGMGFYEPLPTWSDRYGVEQDVIEDAP